MMPFRMVIAVMALLALVACDTAEERAEEHYRKGVALLESGEAEKAALEFRNALKLNPLAVAPRMEFSKILIATGDLRGAADNLNQIVEIAPNNVEARLALARIMLLGGNLEQAERNINSAFTTEPQNLEVRGLKAVIDLRAGRTDAAVELARGIVEEAPSDVAAAQVLATYSMDRGMIEEALGYLDAALADNPADMGLQVSRLRAIEKTGDQARVGEQLRAMYNLDPSNSRIVDSLVQWNLHRDNPAGAEDVLRDRARKFPDNVEYAMSVVGFIDRFEGVSAAREELAVRTQDAPDVPIFRRALAELDVREGRPDEAISRLRDLLESDVENDEKIETQVQLASVLLAEGQMGESSDLIGEILEADTQNVEALKMRGRIAIENDDPETAIADLRQALDNSPQNPDILTLLALAHERNGSRGLAQERLALAVRASDNGVAESIRYAEFLARDENFEVSEAVLEDAIAKRPEAVELRGALARVLLQQSKWDKVQAVLADLREMSGSPRAQHVAAEVEVALLSGQKKFGESIGVLREIWNEAGEKTTAMENLVRSYLLAGKPDDAMEFLDSILADEPKNLRANLLKAATHVFKEEYDEAEARYRKVIEEHPERENGYGALARLLAGQGRTDEARAVMDAGLNNAPDAPGLLFARAVDLERGGDIDGAIAVYEQLYDANKVSDVLANNLASLLSEYRDDEESLERAFAVAKRLRSATNPAFQDTYGWILYKRGEYERALKPLKSAAEGIPNNPLVQYHLGMLYAALGKKEEAVTQLGVAIELAAGADLPQIDVAKETIAQLQNQ